MTGIIMWMVVAAILLILFVVLLMLGIVRKNVNLVIGAVASIMLFMLAGGVAVYKTLRTTVKLAGEVTARRDGNKIYTDLLGTPTGCVKIFASTDPLFPAINAPVALCFSTCPADADRILRSGEYEIVKRPTADVALEAEQCCDNYFSYARFGDTVLECVLSPAPNHATTIWFSTDSTHGFVQQY